MAKSLRSKRRRKMRAEKRVVNAKKELVKLKEVAAKLHASVDPTSGCLTKQSLEANVADLSVVSDIGSGQMEVDSSNASANLSTGKKQLGINSQWMSQRKIKSLKNRIKRHNKKKARRPSSAALGSRKARKSLRKK